MFKRVDGTVKEEIVIDGFSYLDYNEDEVKLLISDAYVTVFEDDEVSLAVAFGDVPKLIFALKSCINRRVFGNLHREELNID